MTSAPCSLRLAALAALAGVSGTVTLIGGRRADCRLLQVQIAIPPTVGFLVQLIKGTS